MAALLARRLLITLPLLVLVSFMVFSLIVLVPGDPAVALAGENPDPERIAEVRERLGLNDPFLVQYQRWATDAVTGDLGTSLYTSQTVWAAIRARLPTTVSLAAVSLLFAMVAGVLVGTLAGLRPGSVVDRVATIVASTGVAVPYFWVGMVFILVFAIERSWFPAIGYVPLTQDPVAWLRHLVLPAVALGLAPAAVIARQARAATRDVLQQDYIRTARAKGLSPVRVIGKHALKNAAVPIVTVAGIESGRLIGGTVVIEQLFALPGIGNLAYQSVFARDFPVVQGVVLVAAAMVLFVNLVVDVSYGYFNPRIRQS